MLALTAVSETAISDARTAQGATFSGVVTYTAVESVNFKIYAATELYITRLADSPPGQPFPGSLEKLPTFDRTIIGGDGFSGLANSWGTAALINTGAYDQYFGFYAVDGREAVFKAGDPTTNYAQFFEVARLIATSIEIDGQKVSINFEDKAFKLAVPTQPHVYLGTGDLEGGPELTGKRKPLAFGRLLNVSPVMLIAAELVMQVSDGAVSSISAVYDKGYPLLAAGDYATPALLRAATIIDGAYATCLAYGLLRLGAGFTQITCDVHGDATGGYVESTGPIIRRIITLTGAIVDPTEVDVVSFTNMDATQPAPIGYFLDANSTETVAQTLDNLSKGVGGFCGFTRLGLLQASIFTAPTGTPAGTYTDLQILDINIEKLPAGFYPPPWRQRVPYENNWTVISDPFPALAVSDPARAAWLATPYKVASTTDAAGTTIKANHLQAQDPEVRKCYFALAVDALAEANRMLTLANSNYQLYRVLLKTHPFTHDLCQTARITDDLWQRFGLGAGKLGRIASISDIPDNNTVELRVLA